MIIKLFKGLILKSFALVTSESSGVSSDFLAKIKAPFMVLFVMALASPVFGQSESRANEASPNRTQQLSNKETAAEITSPLNVSESKRWSLTGSFGYSQDLEPYTDSYVYDYTSLGAQAYYNLSASMLSLSTGYNAPHGRVTSEVERFGMRDTSIGWIKPNVLTIGNVSSDLSTRLSLPTSQTSQIASQYFSSGVTLDTKFELPVRQTLFILGVGGTFAQHEYETANIFGSAPNSPYGVSLRGTLRTTPVRGLLLSTSYQINPFWDYDGIRDTIQSANATAKYSFEKTLSGFISYQWRDYVLTNNALFDSAATSITAGIEVGI